EAVVDEAVAVVVHPVACLGLRRDGALTRAPRAALTRLDTPDALADPDRRRRAGIARLLRPFVARTSLVDFAVAVVVEPVADLGHRGQWLARLHLTVFARLHGHLARALAARHRCEAIVDLAVAIVVLAVARLFVRNDLADARA